MKEVIMIKKYVYGTPFDIESVVEQLPASDGVPSYGTITTEKGFAFSFTMETDDIVYRLGAVSYTHRDVYKRQVHI